MENKQELKVISRPGQPDTVIPPAVTYPQQEQITIKRDGAPDVQMMMYTPHFQTHKLEPLVQKEGN
jgi:hypothetical protein